MRKRKKEYWEMNAEELAAATQEFDLEDIGETFHAMTSAEGKAWRAKAQRRAGGGAEGIRNVTVISLGVEAGLLKRADALAKKRKISRETLIAEGLEALLAKADTPP